MIWMYIFAGLTVIGVALAWRSDHEPIQKLMTILFITWVLSNYLTQYHTIEVRMICFPIIDLFAGLGTAYWIYKFKSLCAKILLCLFTVMGLTHLAYDYINISSLADNYSYMLILNILYAAQLGTIYVGAIRNQALSDLGLPDIFGRSDHSDLPSK